MGNNQRQNQINQFNEQRNQINQQRNKREAEPSMEYSVAASHPAQPEQMTTQNIRNNMNHHEMSPVNNMYRNNYNLPVMNQPMMTMVPMVRKMTTMVPTRPVNGPSGPAPDGQVHQHA